MKRSVYLLTGVLLTSALMIGCGSKATDNQNTQDAQSTQTSDTSNNQKDIQKADLEGEVTSISGNKITLKVIKAPEAPASEHQGAPTGDAAKDANKDTDQSKPADNKDGQGSKPAENMKVEYTGETKDITVGDETKIKTMNMGQQGAESKDITANDIKVGDVLQITYSDKDKETISTINVRSAISQK